MTNPQKSAKKIAIIGAGPAGCMAAFWAQEKAEVTLFDSGSPLRTILYTGGGRCNLAYEEYYFKDLAKFYPRGEKFLYSVFSAFSTADTIDYFNKIGVETYTQDDLRIFPTSDSAKEVRKRMLSAINHCGIKCEKVLNINKTKNDFLITAGSNDYNFDKVIISIGGHAGFSLAKTLGHTIIEAKPALVGLITKNSFKSIQGVSLKNITAKAYFENQKITQITDDILFTHQGISGPLAYKISSICARLNYTKQNPLIIKLDFTTAPHPQPLSRKGRGEDTLQYSLSSANDLQAMLNANPKKDIKNLVSDFVTKSMAEYILNINEIALDTKCCNINGKMRDSIIKSLTDFEITVTSPSKEGEVVTSGGVSLDEINPKTMESKLVEGLYFAGEVIDVDGFCGGFNLQNCWSTGYIAGTSI